MSLTVINGVLPGNGVVPGSDRQLWIPELLVQCIILLGMVLVLAAPPAQAATEAREFDSAEQRALYLKLINEFRCLKCQNQNLAGSAADLADDLKSEIYAMVLENKSGAEISDFLVARYGDFVRYRPVFKSSTALLWLAPFILMIIGLWLLTRFAGKRQAGKQQSVQHATDEELARARAMLED